jgi:hypothetical protein
MSAPTRGDIHCAKLRDAGLLKKMTDAPGYWMSGDEAAVIDAVMRPS